MLFQFKKKLHSIRDSMQMMINYKKSNRIFVAQNVIFVVCYFISLLAMLYIFFNILHYVHVKISILFFICMVVFLLILLLIRKRKRTLSIILQILFMISLCISSVFVYRITSVTSKILENIESETVALVTLQKSILQQDTSFEGLRIGFVKSDSATNHLLEELLIEEGKETFEEIFFDTYEEAYRALSTHNIDMMAYTAYAQGKLLEVNIKPDIKVILSKQKILDPVVSTGVDITRESFTVLVSGVDDTSLNINENGSSDVNILVAVNPHTNKAALQVIPRDLRVYIPCVNGESKLTYAGAWGGISCSIQTIENYLGIHIDYYAKINFQGVIDLIDAMGGIRVQSYYDFCGHESCFVKGENEVNGRRALEFSRTRRVLPEGDVSRGKHQMEVIQGVVQKFIENPRLSYLNALLDSIQKNFTTNLEKQNLVKVLYLLKKLDLDLNTNSMEGTLAWDYDGVTNEYLYYFYPAQGEIDVLKKRLDDLLNGS